MIPDAETLSLNGVSEMAGKVTSELSVANTLAAGLETSANINPHQGMQDLAAGEEVDGPTVLQELVGKTPKKPSELADPGKEEGSMSEAEFNETKSGQEKLAEKTANECLTSATDSVRADILKDMAKDGEPVKLDADGWPVDGIQKVKVLDAMEKRQGEIEDNALKAAVAERLGPIPNDPQEQRTWRENYKKGVDAALDAKKKLKDSNGAKAADAAGTAGAAPAEGETAPAPAAPEAKGEKKESTERQNTLASAFKDATDYLLAQNENAQKKAGTKAATTAGASASATESAGAQPKEKPGSITKEKIMEAVDKFDKTPEGNGYKKKFIFALVSLTAILGIALEGVSNLDEKAKQEMHRSEQIGSSHS